MAVLARRGEYDNSGFSEFGALADFRGQSESIRARHLAIEQNELERCVVARRRLQFAQRLSGVGRNRGPDAHRFHHLRQDTAGQGVVVYDERRDPVKSGRFRWVRPPLWR